MSLHHNSNGSSSRPEDFVNFASTDFVDVTSQGASAGHPPKFSQRIPASSQSQSAKRIQADLEEITRSPLDFCSAGPKGDNIFEWIATIEGPPGTVYDGGVYFLEVHFTPDYPFKPPKVVFKTRIYHCNVNSQGLICSDILKDNWSSTYNIRNILSAIYELLCECNPRDPLVANIAKQYLQNREEHDRIARTWTQRYAS